MPIQTQNPAGLATPQGYSHVAVASGSRIVYLAGQVGQDAEGNLVGPGDLAAQTEQAWRNVATALAAAGAATSDIAKIVYYVVNWRPELREPLVQGTMRVAPALGLEMNRPATLIGVASLAVPEFLIEIDVTAVVE